MINLGEADIETPEIVLTRIRNTKYLAAERLIVASLTDGTRAKQQRKIRRSAVG